MNSTAFYQWWSMIGGSYFVVLIAACLLMARGSKHRKCDHRRHTTPIYTDNLLAPGVHVADWCPLCDTTIYCQEWLEKGE